MTRKQMLRAMDSDEYVDWMAMFQLEPFGDEWRQAATPAAAIHNAMGGKKKGGAFTPDDFMPTGNRAQTPAEIERNLRLSLGGR